MTQALAHDPTPRHVRAAVRYLGVEEVPLGSNRGAPIDDWRARFNIPEPVPWCGIYSSVVSADGRVVAPQVFSSVARDFVVRGYSRRLSDVIYRRYTPQPGDYRVKTRRGGNHVDIVVAWDAEAHEGLVIGGNVGHGVRLRRATLRSMIADGTTHITHVEGDHNYVDAPFDAEALLKAVSDARGEQ